MGEKSRDLWKVGVVGLGPMGMPIAINLAKAGVTTFGWNRSPNAFGPLADAGGIEVDTIVLVDADIVFAVLPDIDQLEPLLPLLADRVKTIVVMSTSSPSRMRQLASATGRRFSFVDAPMSGGVEGAVNATLSLMVGSTSKQFKELLPLLRIVGGTVEHMGALGCGMMAKLCNQIVVAGTLASNAEAIAMAEAAKLDLPALVRIFSGGLAQSAVLDAKKDRLLGGGFSGGGSIRNQVKDLRYALDEAAALGVYSPLTSAAYLLFSDAAKFNAEMDHSVVIEEIRRRNAKIASEDLTE